jgi:hypothetical protein
MQLMRWHGTATDESTECTNGAFVIASSALTTLYIIGIHILRSLYSDTIGEDGE